jgi:hypothetical protein
MLGYMVSRFTVNCPALKSRGTLKRLGYHGRPG